jgi:hypothetical protein
MRGSIARSTAMQVIFIPPATKKPGDAIIPLRDGDFELKP